ncbi:MAG: bifunctional demethylmenaquinone methyltransferase/2-methoxy-6-polyprenyl-1,4-benzoquinol methylase UbiE [Paracoccaceae bacterium]|nr:bifunctional demethylmenaquinone methyltransferase/2-methoxy-6-polyprenyl-1,4-benzoquinol methylase UbiE [Paracoccaceae bacterium]
MDNRDRTAQTVDFGSATVKQDSKPALVRGVFESVAGRYDVMNDAMSFGVHRLWKSAMIDWLAPWSGMRLLDIAGGTGDVAVRFLNRTNDTHAIVLDMTASMLNVGRRRARRAGQTRRLHWVAGDATALPFDDRSFDACTLAFGLRNIARREDAIREAWRVLRLGGRFLVLEFSQVPNASLRRLYDAYSWNVIPRLGSMIANDRDSYRYLVESIRQFPDPERLADMIRTGGFERVRYQRLSLGVVALHSGWKL